MRTMIWGGVLPLLLAACATNPGPMPRPDAGLPAAFPAPPGASAPAAAPGWQGVFADPALRQLTAAALEHNRDLRLATLNVEAARAQFGIQRAARLPTVALEASGQRERALAGDERPTTARSQQLGVNLGLNAFELDLFGRVRSLSDAALARYLASEHGQRAARLTLVGAVADAYFEQRLALAQRDLAERTLADWNQTLALVRLQRDAGQGSALDLVQAEGETAAAEAELQARRRALEQAGNALRLLVGTALPDTLPPALALDGPPVATVVPAGLPSQQLLRRPDLQQAEQLLAAAQAEIGAARAAFFPQISLTAAFGIASPSLDGLFDGQRRVWRFAPQVGLPLFDGGRLRQELRLAELRQSEEVARYERSIQVAFREVADALAAAATLGPQIGAQSRAVASAERRVVLTELRYRAGLEGRLELLDARRQHHGAQLALLSLRREELGNAVALVLALGGEAAAEAAEAGVAPAGGPGAAISPAPPPTPVSAQSPPHPATSARARTGTAPG